MSFCGDTQGMTVGGVSSLGRSGHLSVALKLQPSPGCDQCHLKSDLRGKVAHQKLNDRVKG